MTEPAPIAPPADRPRAWWHALGKPSVAGLLIALAVAAFQLASLDHYAMAVDSPALLYSGERTLHFFAHPSDPNALTFGGAEPAGFHSHFEARTSSDGRHYPVLPALVSSLASRVLCDGLGWLDPIEGHHAGLVLLNALALFLFCLYASALLGRGAGIAATVALALFPSALAHAPNNPKDWPCAQFYGLAILAVATGVMRSRARHVLAGGALWGVSFAAKMNAAFVLPTLLLWAPLAWLLVFRKKRAITPGAAAACTALPYLAFLFFFATWPYLWHGSLADSWSHLSEYGAHVLGYGVSERLTWTSYPLRALAFMSPPLILLCALACLATGWKLRGEALAVWSLLVLWTLLPIARIAAPRSNFYDANRHFLEYIPGLCAMAGAGAMALLPLARRAAARLKGPAWRERAVAPALGGLALAALIWPVAEYHPYEVAYYNSLIGGLGGAQQHALFAMPAPQDFRANGSEGDYWSSSLRDAVKDLHARVGPGQEISTCGCLTGHPSGFMAWSNDLAREKLKFVACADKTYRTSPFMIASPREFSCWWRELREHESERPVLKRVERGGGLIYEILGQRTGASFTPASPHSRYEDLLHPVDKAGQRLAAAQKLAAGRPIVKRQEGGEVIYDVVDPASGQVVFTSSEPR